MVDDASISNFNVNNVRRANVFAFALVFNDYSSALFRDYLVDGAPYLHFEVVILHGLDDVRERADLVTVERVLCHLRNENDYNVLVLCPQNFCRAHAVGFGHFDIEKH